ncbi:MAG: DNA starvation/stationary phase protection protein [Bacilli bacterium]|nr:DNA starvation/stationary phase protection protein [Bacilli bacterium]
MNKNLIMFLNKEVSNYGVLYVKLHNFHWLVKGKMFYQLHEKFEDLYDEVTETFDALAERVLMIGGKPVAALQEFLNLASIKEANSNESTSEMVASIIADFELLNEEFGEGIKLAEERDDDVTVDLFTGIKASLQKHIWMLKATQA